MQKLDVAKMAAEMKAVLMNVQPTHSEDAASVMLRNLDAVVGVAMMFAIEAERYGEGADSSQMLANIGVVLASGIMHGLEGVVGGYDDSDNGAEDGEMTPRHRAIHLIIEAMSVQMHLIMSAMADPEMRDKVTLGRVEIARKEVGDA